MHQAIGEPRIILRAAPAVTEVLEPRLAEIAHEEGYEGRVLIAADPAMTGADCRIEWRGGGAERSESRHRGRAERPDRPPFLAHSVKG